MLMTTGDVVTHTVLRVLLVSVVGALSAGPAAASGAQPTTQDLKRLTLEELMRIEVTLVTRQPEPVGTSAAAVSVITREDLRRSGVTTIADAIALADGMHVARLNTGSWAISSRGFNGSTPNKLLVMIDGRNEFSPLFAGVFWNTIDYVLEDIERIEVIRGPGATLWGANAVNGVINIVTRHARETHGTFVSFGSGTEDPASIDVRYGAGSGETSYRVYGKFAARDHQQLASGASGGDGRRRGQGGFRVDATRGVNEWLLKGDAFHSRDEFLDRRDGEFTTLAVQGRFRRTLSPGSELQIQSYYRREYRNVARQLTHHLDTGDVDAQHAFRPGTRHHVVWGGAFRVNRDHTYGSAVIAFDPPSRTYPIVSAFAQDEFALRPDSVFVTAGIKLEHNGFSGAEWQPNLRARWLLPRGQLIWGAIAHATRRPTRFDDDVLVFGPGGLVLVRGSDDFASEGMTGGELGYRARPIPSVSLAATGFVQAYDRLRSQDAPAAGLLPVTVGNSLNGRSSGIELSATLQPVDRIRVSAGYTHLRTEVTRDPGSRDVGGGVSEGNDPRHLFNLRAAVNLWENVEADAWVRGVSALPNPAVPAYTELNARIGWQFTPTFELALTGQDLLHDSHPEFGASVPGRIEFQRSVRANLTIRIP
jgi:iron complex outermembrane receptor protein